MSDISNSHFSLTVLGIALLPACVCAQNKLERLVLCMCVHIVNTKHSVVSQVKTAVQALIHVNASFHFMPRYI